MSELREQTRHGEAVDLLAQLKSRIGCELHDYPYPIAGCDEAFKTLVHQKECCRIALAGLAGEPGITPEDVATAIGELMATPIALDAAEAELLQSFRL